MMYEELVKELRKMQSVEYCVIASAEDFPAIKIVDEAADAIEKLQAYADLYRDGGETAMRTVEQYKARIEELQKQLQKSETDNVNLTGWLAEEHANKCPHYIRNVHDRGDDSLCDKYKCEVNALPRWIPVTERLPEKEKASYLCRTDGGYHCEVRWTDNVYGLWTGGGGKWGWSIFDIPQYSKVTHWMPLPEPPKEETE